jgi:hypothetical protein
MSKSPPQALDFQAVDKVEIILGVILYGFVIKFSTSEHRSDFLLSAFLLSLEGGKVRGLNMKIVTPRGFLDVTGGKSVGKEPQQPFHSNLFRSILC